MSHRFLIAGLGNIFLGDDGFGVEVIRRLSAQLLPESIRVADFGIRTLHLAYELLDGGYEATLLVDAAQIGDQPGTVYFIKPNLDQIVKDSSAVCDAHGMDLTSVLRLLKTLGVNLETIHVVGCEPLQLGEQIGLSKPVSEAVEEALRLIHEKIAHW